jgi:Tfp pilus assembly protein PilN
MAQSSSLLEKELKQGRDSLGAGWPWHLLLFMIVIVGLLVLIYLGMLWGYEPYLGSRIRGQEQKLTDLGNSLASATTNDLARFYSELSNSQKILAEHTVASGLLDVVEANLHPNVYLTGLEIQSPQKTIRLMGIARDYGSLGAELTLLSHVAGITSVLLEDSSTRDQGDVRFTIRLVADPPLFKAQ